MNILAFLTQPQVVSNMYEIIYSAEHNWKIFWM